MSSKHEELKTALNLANETIKSTYQALRSLGVLRKVDYKMLQLSPHSIRGYYKIFGALEPEYFEDLQERKEFDFNAIDFKDEHVVRNIGRNANYYFIKNIYEAKNYATEKFLANVANTLLEILESTIFSVCSWHQPESTSEHRKNLERDKMFKDTIKTIGRQLIKHGNYKEILMGDPRNECLHEFK